MYTDKQRYENWPLLTKFLNVGGSSDFCSQQISFKTSGPTQGRSGRFKRRSRSLSQSSTDSYSSGSYSGSSSEEDDVSPKEKVQVKS